jgi:prepilin-type N-terminal cleavage/methylation domain-containing protein
MSVFGLVFGVRRTVARKRTTGQRVLHQPTPNLEHRTLNTGQRGFTLIEILMALTIMLVGVVGIYAVFAVGLVNHKRAVDNTTAANLAASLFDDIAANYDVYYADNNRNGIPDNAEDRNRNGIDDWFETDAGGRARLPIPYKRGYNYIIRYERNADVPQELLVMVQVYWLQAGVERAEPFQRAIFIKHLPDLDSRQQGE